MQGEAKTWQMEQTVHKVHIYSYSIHPLAWVSKSDRRMCKRLTGGRVISYSEPPVRSSVLWRSANHRYNQNRPWVTSLTDCCASQEHLWAWAWNPNISDWSGLSNNWITETGRTNKTRLGRKWSVISTSAGLLKQSTFNTFSLHWAPSHDNLSIKKHFVALQVYLLELL